MNQLARLRMSIGYTLVDITKTNEVSGLAFDKARNQQRNYETLVQVLSLRTQLIVMSEPEIFEANMSGTRFGKDFIGAHKIWIFKFGVEQDSVFSNSKHSHGTLAEDFTNVPIITGLDETAKLEVPTFVVTGPQTNIYFDVFKF